MSRSRMHGGEEESIIKRQTSSEIGSKVPSSRRGTATRTRRARRSLADRVAKAGRGQNDGCEMERLRVELTEKRKCPVQTHPVEPRLGRMDSKSREIVSERSARVERSVECPIEGSLGGEGDAPDEREDRERTPALGPVAGHDVRVAPCEMTEGQGEHR